MVGIPTRMGRPDFIAAEDFRAYKTARQLNRIAAVAGIRATSFIGRCERAGRPIRHTIVHGAKHWRLLDIVARARAECVDVTPPLEVVAALELDALRAEAAKINESLAGARHVLACNAISAALTNRQLLTADEIVAASQPWCDYAGVYFLIADGRVVYVGQSINVHARIRSHAATRTFSAFAYVRCQRNELDMLESLYINVLRPEWNKTYTYGNRQRTPLSLDALLARVPA